MECRAQRDLLVEEAWLRLGSGELLPDHNPRRVETDESPGRKAFLVFAVILVGSLISWFPAVAGDEKARDKVFVGYLFGRPKTINFGLYTHLCHAFLVADEQGNVRSRRDVPSKSLADEAHQVRGQGAALAGGLGLGQAVRLDRRQARGFDRYTKAVIEIVDASDYDGIDLDWEYPDTKEEVAGFDRLARRFRKELDAIGRRKNRPMVLTMAASSNAGTLRWLGKELLLETMDWINVMTYDYAGAWTPYAGHNCAAPCLVEAARRQAALDGAVDAVPDRGAGNSRRSPGRRHPALRPRIRRVEAVRLDQGRAKTPRPRGQLQQPRAADQGGLDADLGRGDRDPLADLARQVDGDRLRRRRVGRPQDRMGHEAGLPRRLLLADRRRPACRTGPPPCRKPHREVGPWQGSQRPDRLQISGSCQGSRRSRSSQLLASASSTNSHFAGSQRSLRRFQ